MGIIRFSYADNWTVNSGFLAHRATFNCGRCQGENYTVKTTHLHYNREEIVVAECQNCGQYNAFRNQGSLLIIS